MKDEIKEILDNIKKCCDITKDQSFTVYQRQDILKLLDYITNLQEENEELKDYLKIMEKGKDNNLNRFLDYKSRIDKAIEYINEHWGSWCSDHYTNATNVVNILNGGDE